MTSPIKPSINLSAPGIDVDIDPIATSSLKRTSPTVYSVKSPNDGSTSIELPDDKESNSYLRTSFGFSTLNSSVPKGEFDLIKTYRDMAISSDVDEAIQEIINEVFAADGREPAFKPMFKPKSNVPSSVQKKIEEAFEYIYYVLLNFDTEGHSILRQWYIDGRFFFHIAVDDKQKTIKYLQPIDPLFIRRFRKDFISRQTGLVDVARSDYFYLYIPPEQQKNNRLETFWNGFRNDLSNKNYCINFSSYAIAYADSGLYDRQNNTVLSHLYKAIIPFNNMRMMEEAMMIYRIVRAPERRAFYVDVGNMGSQKAMQYVNDIKNTFNNKTVFDSSTGAFINRKTVHAMTEDYYLPRRDGQRGTEIQTLGGAENLGVTKDIEYLRDKFYRALNVPAGRLNPEQQQSTLLLGRVSEMQRDEYRFKRFIDHLRDHFMPLIEKILKTELVLRGSLTEAEWDKHVVKDFYWEFTEDNSFTEIKKTEKQRAKLELLDAYSPHIGKFFSEQYIMKEVLGFTDKEIKDMKSQIEDEAPDEEENNDGEDGGNKEGFEDGSLSSGGEVTTPIGNNQYVYNPNR